MSAAKLLASRRIRATPYTSRVESLGVSAYSVVNHTILPKGFQRSAVEDYWHLKEHVQLWDVACQRQVEIRGPDAAYLTQLMTPRNLRDARVGQCLYAPMIDEAAGMLNDPIILKIAEDCFWLSIADSDVLLWAKGLATGMRLNVTVCEPDVWPLAVQGPKSTELMARVFGEAIKRIEFFQFSHVEFNGCPLLVARSGYSKQGGFELYLDQPALGEKLWDVLWAAGEDLHVSPGCPNLIERIEGGLLSYGNEMTRADNPLECGLEKYCHLDGEIEFIGDKALQAIAAKGVEKKMRGILFDGDACPPCQQPWQLKKQNVQAGYITSAIWSPRFEKNIALAMVSSKSADGNDELAVHLPDGDSRNGEVVFLPFS